MIARARIERLEQHQVAARDRLVHRLIACQSREENRRTARLLYTWVVGETLPDDQVVPVKRLQKAAAALSEAQRLDVEAKFLFYAKARLAQGQSKTLS